MDISLDVQLYTHLHTLLSTLVEYNGRCYKSMSKAKESNTLAFRRFELAYNTLFSISADSSKMFLIFFGKAPIFMERHSYFLVPFSWTERK